jgi:hypothetical protein
MISLATPWKPGMRELMGFCKEVLRQLFAEGVTLAELDEVTLARAAEIALAWDAGDHASLFVFVPRTAQEAVRRSPGFLLPDYTRTLPLEISRLDVPGRILGYVRGVTVSRWDHIPQGLSLIVALDGDSKVLRHAVLWEARSLPPWYLKD